MKVFTANPVVDVLIASCPNYWRRLFLDETVGAHPEVFLTSSLVAHLSFYSRICCHCALGCESRLAYMRGVKLIPLCDYFTVRRGHVTPPWPMLCKKMLWDLWEVFSSLVKWETCLEPPSWGRNPRLKVYTLCLLKKPILRKICKFKEFIWGAP